MKNSLHQKLRKYQNIKSTNNLLYFLSNAPILSYFFNADLVSEYEAKEGINLAINSVTYLIDFFKKMMYLLILSIMFKSLSNGFIFFFILITIVGSIFRKINKFDEEDYDNVILLRADSNKYVKYKINNYVIKEFILMSIAILLIHVEMNINYLFLLCSVVIYINIHLISEMIYIKKIEKKELNRKSLIDKFICLICIVFIGVFYYYQIFIPNNFIILTIILLLPLGIKSYLYLMNYKSYKILHKKYLNLELINDIKMLRQINSNESKVKNTTNTISLNVEEKEKKGYEYLYSMFLKRYNKSMRTGEIITNIIIIIVGTILIMAPFIDNSIDKKDFVNTIFNGLSMLFFIMYIISANSKNFLNLCFFEMDRYLINYNFYRSENAIDKNLRLRLNTIIKRSLFPTIFISLCLTLIFLIHSEKLELVKIIVGVTLPFILSMFFSLFHITMYYLFQPYSFSGTIVNKTFKMLDYLIYITVYIIFYSNVVFNLMILIIISIILFIISIVLYILVLKQAPKTFRVR